MRAPQNNLNIRLTQGRAQHRHFALGLGVIPNATDVNKIVQGGLKAGATFIGTGSAQYDAVAVVVNVAGRWVIRGIVEAEGAGVSAKLAADFPNLVVRAVAPSSPASKSTGGAMPMGRPSLLPGGSTDLTLMVRSFHEALKASQLIFSEEIVTRFCASLLTRRFLVLTGLSGSGKTKLAEAFARWVTPTPVSGIPPHSKIVPVGADWTSSEQVLGHADALDPKRYETKPTLDILLHASAAGRDNDVHMLILDEMNLSHVERYFSEFLSAMETGAAIELYSGPDRDRVPSGISLPPNLFVAGTVNVDETTYLFSPKVLDRANVIEFRADEDQIFGYLENFGAVDLSMLDGKGVPYMTAFVQAAAGDATLEDADREAVAEAFRRVFRILGIFGREFGFRTLRRRALRLFPPSSYRIVRVDCCRCNRCADIPARIYPRLHGSRNQLQQLIWALGTLCMNVDLTASSFESDVVEQLRRGGSIASPFDTPEGAAIVKGGFVGANYPMSAEKLYRMNRKLRDGFVSFMEA